MFHHSPRESSSYPTTDSSSCHERLYDEPHNRSRMRPELVLTAEERSTLEPWARCPKTPQRVPCLSVANGAGRAITESLTGATTRFAFPADGAPLLSVRRHPEQRRAMARPSPNGVVDLEPKRSEATSWRSARLQTPC